MYAISRISAIAAFNCRPQSLRLVLSALLEPFLEYCRKSGNERNSDVGPSATSFESSAVSHASSSVQSASLPSSPIGSSPPPTSSKPLIIVSD